MDDYISRGNAIETVISYEFNNCPAYMLDFATKLKSAVCSDIRDDLQALPAADVRQAIRCNNCRYYFFGDCTHNQGMRKTDKDGFCFRFEAVSNCGADMRDPNLDTTKWEGRDESSG